MKKNNGNVKLFQGQRTCRHSRLAVAHAHCYIDNIHRLEDWSLSMWSRGEMLSGVAGGVGVHDVGHGAGGVPGGGAAQRPVAGGGGGLGHHGVHVIGHGVAQVGG